jgi:hypothetical protein
VLPVSRRGLDRGPVGDALKLIGLEREIVTTVGGFSVALALARTSDLIARFPNSTRLRGCVRDVCAKHGRRQQPES